MFGIGTEELMLILVIALVVLGPERMPKLARDLGRMVGEFRKTSDDLRNEFLNADRIIDVAAKSVSTPAAITPAAAPESPLDGGAPLSAASLLGTGEPPASEAAETAPAASGPESPVDAENSAPGETAAISPDPADPDETRFDREAREARERLHDPERARQASAEGWKTPADEAGTTDRWG